MYQVGKRIHKHRRFWKRLGWLSMMLIFAALVYFLLHLKVAPEQNVHNSPPVSKTYQPSSKQKITFDKPLLTIELPAGWKEVTLPTSPTAPVYALRNSELAEALDIYIDNPPLNMGLNKAIVVSQNAAGVAHDVVSDNCIAYTQAGKTNPQTGNAPAKWQGIDFFCDTANSSRAVVGTVSKDSFNYFNSNGQSGGTHKVFITYTDNNISPDYSILYDALDSLHFK